MDSLSRNMGRALCLALVGLAFAIIRKFTDCGSIINGICLAGAVTFLLLSAAVFAGSIFRQLR